MERPIIFSAPMVRAILEGRKTQTRRIAKITGVMGDKLPVTAEGERLIELEPGEFNRGVFHYESLSALSGPYRLPYAVGDTLWVREGFADTAGMGFDVRFHYKADVRDGSESDEIRKQYGVKWKPSIHMPRIASRITLKVTGVKVERLQDISEDDAKAEGASPKYANGWPSREHIGGFYEIWQSINGPGSWEENPWVAAISFERVST